MEQLLGLDTGALLSWVQSEVLPHLVSVSMILGVALVELIPAVRSLIKARAAFTKVASDVDAYNRSKLEYDLRVEERERAFEARIEAIEEEHRRRTEEMLAAVSVYETRLAQSEERMTRLLEGIARSTSRAERMIYLGMSNSCELIVNGAARKISKIEEECYEEDGTGGENGERGGGTAP